MEKPRARLSRRSFLFAATAGTAATAAGLVATQQAPNSPGHTGDTPSKKGYQLSEHVRNYYRTAKI